MRLDQATFAFGFTIKNSAGNPNWGTSLGQGREYKINSFTDAEEILKGMVYSSVSLDRIELRIGKGGALRKGSDPSAGLVVGSVFNKVFVNDDLVEDCSLILVINKDSSPSHFGRLRLKYSPSNSFIRDDGKKVSNEDGLSKIRGKLGITSDACWFVYALTIINQDELHLSAVVVNKAHPVEYMTTADLHAAWEAMIEKEEHLNLKGEFIKWAIDIKKMNATSSNALDSYVDALERATIPDPGGKPASSHKKTIWYNIYRHLHGKQAPKGVFEVDNVKEFNEIFGSLKLTLSLATKDPPPTVIKTSFHDIQQWIKGHSGGAFPPPAFSLYEEFLQWREKNKSSQENRSTELSLSVDRLSIALKMFEEWRGTADHEMSYDESTARIRAQGQIIDGDYLVGCDYASFRKTLHDKQVANSYFARHTDEDKRKLGEFMAAARNDPKDISHYLNRENRPEVSGVGDMLLTAFLTRVRPDLYAFYSNPLFVVVKLLGMTKDDALPQMTLGSYNTYKDIQTIIRDRMREMGIKAENGNDADYLTVNEFTWFVYANLDLVKDAMLPELRVPENVDRLSIALKQFANKRKEDGKDGWLEAGRAVNGRIREYFDPLTEEAIGAFGEEQIEELFCGKKSADGKVELVTMWSGKNGQGWSHIKKGLDDGKRHEIVGYLVSLKHDLEIASRFCLPDFDWHYGFGRSVISELLMKFHPENCIKHGERSYSALSWLRLIDFPWARKYSSEEYSQVCGAAAKILAKMKAMDMPRQINADGTEDDSPPDYLTVNEFLYFVDTNLDKIKEEVMSKQLKPVNSKEKIKKGTRTLEDAFKDDEMLKRLAAALRTKPFAILAGHSGTGKSRLVRRLAYMTCNNELLVAEGAGKAAPGNYCMVQVKPNWHDSTDLLGYYSEMGGRHFVNTPFVQFICKAYAYPDTPFFVCLDEMNLAPVEQYFAEYLSAVESMEKKGDVWVTDLLVEIDKTGEKDAEGREKIDADILGQIMKGAASTEAAEWIQKHGLTIPKNLFVVGTVNVDETTSQFPRKVLDRAMTLLMNEVRFADMANSKSPSEEALLDEPGLKFFLERDDRTVGERESKLLDGINAPLVNTPFMVAYRFGNEYALYEAALAKLDGVDLASADESKQDEIASRALDHVVIMKLLPRIHGEKVAVKNIFCGYDRKKEGGATEHIDGLKSKLPADGLSVAMMGKILARDDEYLTFWP